MLPDDQLLDWLNQKSETRFVFGLERMHAALDYFKPQTSAVCIQVLGTNGKGSSIECLKNILRAHEKNVACYTSPHLFNLYDRFVINDVAMTQVDFMQHLQLLYTVEKNQKIPSLSYFEITTFLAYLYFCSKNLDYMLIEAGLGGRLDATSALLFSHLMFTSIDYDHQQYLGKRLSEIAQEKFSVIRSHHMVFSIAQTLAAKSVLLQHIDNTHALLRLENEHFSMVNNKQTLDYHVYGHDLKDIELGLNGEHQFHNALLATDLASHLLGAWFNPEKTKHALKHTHKPGRYQSIVMDNTTFTLDVAHNQQSFDALMQTSTNDNIDAYFVSMLQDKPWQAILNQLITHNKPIYVFIGLSERSWSRTDLLDFIKQHPQANITVFDDYKDGLHFIQEQHQHCLVFGSFFFVGPCIEHLTISEP